MKVPASSPTIGSDAVLQKGLVRRWKQRAAGTSSSVPLVASPMPRFSAPPTCLSSTVSLARLSVRTRVRR